MLEVVYSLKSDGMLANMIIDNIEEAGQIKEKPIKEDYQKILV